MGGANPPAFHFPIRPCAIVQNDDEFFPKQSKYGVIAQFNSAFCAKKGMYVEVPLGEPAIRAQAVRICSKPILPRNWSQEWHCEALL